MAGSASPPRPSPHSPAAVTIVSIGYEDRTLEELVEDLAGAEVEVLVDVRMTPSSRKRGLSKGALAAALAEGGIEYRHAPELGNPRDNRSAFGGASVELGRERYRQHLEYQGLGAYEAVVALARERRVALLCVERDERRCHRGCITDRAQAESADVSVLAL
ncbi:MAG: DUF488 family protein [Acidimicrobiia bacterium]|nr:DUF488 family protein [Acidimicrobiia bacterium]